MNTFRIFGKGAITASRRGGMLLGLWAADLVFGLVAVMPVFFLLNSEFGHSLAGKNLGRLNFLWIGDLLYKYGELVSTLPGWLAVPAVIFVLFSIFLNGGIVGSIVAEREKTGFHVFFSDCGKYFLRFVRTFLLSIPVYAFVFGSLFRLISAPLNSSIRAASSELPVIIASNLKFLIVLLLLAIVQMFFGYVKIDLAARDGEKAVRAAVLMLNFLARRFFRAWGLYLMVGGLFVAASAVFLAVTHILPQRGVLAPWAGLLWGQLFILARVWIKILFPATEFEFYKKHRLL